MEYNFLYLKTENPTTLKSIEFFALALTKQGHCREAEGFYLQAVAGREKVLGERHPDTIRCMENLAAMYHDQGRSKEVEEINVEVLELQEVLGERHPETIWIMARCTQSRFRVWRILQRHTTGRVNQKKLKRLTSRCLSYRRRRLARCTPTRFGVQRSS
jgi:hypothetical protein